MLPQRQFPAQFCRARARPPRVPLSLPLGFLASPCMVVFFSYVPTAARSSDPDWNFARARFATGSFFSPSEPPSRSPAAYFSEGAAALSFDAFLLQKTQSNRSFFFLRTRCRRAAPEGNCGRFLPSWFFQQAPEPKWTILLSN